MSALAVVSGDRRYVRLSLVPSFSTLTDVQTFSFINSGNPNGGGGGGVQTGGGGRGSRYPPLTTALSAFVPGPIEKPPGPCRLNRAFDQSGNGLTRMFLYRTTLLGSWAWMAKLPLPSFRVPVTPSCSVNWYSTLSLIRTVTSFPLTVMW